MYLNEITNTNDKASSFYNLRGLESLDCVMIDLFIGNVISYNQQFPRRYYPLNWFYNFNICMILLSGGSETTATLLNWTILYLLHHPDVQEKVSTFRLVYIFSKYIISHRN